MKKTTKDKPKQTPKAFKEFIPPSYPHLRENNPVLPPNQANREYYPDIIPREIPKEWNEQEVKDIFLNQVEGQVFSDPQLDSIFLPHTLFKDYLNNEVKWSRPEEYIKENQIEREIVANFPNKNKLKFRNKIREMYFEEKDQKEIGRVEEVESDSFEDLQRDKYSIYRDFFKIIDSKPEIRIVNSISRDETDQEMEERIRKEEEELIEKMKKDPKQKQIPSQALRKKNTTDILIERKKKFIPMPSNISLKNGYPLFCRWVASMYQIIKDRNILDVNTGETIWQKIYPQKNNIPIYNPNGRYIVKLYYMGKHRQIEIDDTMPCTRYDEFYLPRCELLNELWPAILTKAIIKLYSYSYVSSTYNECGDYAPFLALTGLIPHTYCFDSISKKFNSENIELVKEVLSDTNYTNKNVYILCFRKEKEEPREETKDIIKQSRFEKESISVSSSSIKKLKTMSFKRQSTQLARSTQALIELKHLRGNQLIPNSSLFDDSDLMSPSKKFKKKEDSNKLIIKPMEGEKIIDEGNNFSYNDLKTVTLNQFKNKNKNKNKRVTINENSTCQSNAKEGIEKYENKIYIGILYDVIEYFDNHEFNMIRLKPIDFSDLKEMVKQLNTVYVFKQLSKEEKKMYIEKLKVIKQKQKTEKARRVDELLLKGSSFECFKINNSSVEDPKLYITYTDEEIEITKKCLLNKWEFPPMEYLEKVFEEKTKYGMNPASKDKEGKPETETEKKKYNENTIPEESYGKAVNILTIKAIAEPNNTINNLLENSSRAKSWNKDVYLQLINNNVEQYLNSQEVIIREKGTWVDITEFFNCFNSILLLSNPNVFKNTIEWDNNIYNSNEYLAIDESKQVIHLTPDDSNPNMSPYVILLFSANPDNSNKYRDIPYKINFDLLIKYPEKSKISKTKIKLRSFLDTNQIKLEKTNEYFLMFEGGIFPSGFYFKLICDFKVETMNYSNYLTQYLNYTKSSFKVEHPIIENNKPYLLLRLKIFIEENTHFYLITSQKDNYILEFTQCVLIDNTTMNQTIISFDNSISLKSNISKEYLIVIFVNSPYNVQEESYDVDILYDTQSSIVNAIDNIPIYDISGSYIPNKHYFLFKEFIFSGDKTYAMMYIKIRKMIKVENEDGVSLPHVTKNINVKDKAANNIAVPQFKEVPITDKIRMKIELYGRENELISILDFYNETIIYNFIFEGNVLLPEKDKSLKALKSTENNNATSKPGNIPYLMRCYIDKTELPSWFSCAEDIMGLEWLIRIYSSDTLGFCKDTTKEDMERNMINSWEIVEQGRSKLAQNSRRRFLLGKQKASGSTLTEEDDTFLSNPRQKKSGFQTVCQTETTLATNPNINTYQKNKNNNQSKQQNKNEKELLLQQQLKNEKDNEINMNKTLPLIDSHSSLYIKNFLFYAYKHRLLKFDSKLNQDERRLNTEEEAKEKSDRIIEIFEQSSLRTITETKEIFKTQLGAQAREIYHKVFSTRKEEEKSLMPLIQKREQVMATITLKQENEKKLNDIIQSIKSSSEEKNKTKFDLNAYVQQYKEIISNGLNFELSQQVHKVISNKKEEIIQAQIKKVPNGKEKEFKQIAKQHLEDINANQWTINSDIMERLSQLSK